MTILLVVNAASAWCMTGIGWFVQSVHYPLFPYARGEDWTEFHAAHSRRTALVVGIPWAAQGCSALAILVAQPAGVSWWLPWVAVGLAGISVAGTLAFALPAHSQLAFDFSEAPHRRLLRTGWIRTLAWTGAGVVGSVMVIQHT